MFSDAPQKNDLDEIRTHILELKTDILGDYIELICLKICDNIYSSFKEVPNRGCKTTIPNTVEL